ncbi:MAG: hypothetical protein P8X84_05780 [Candidatus Bathyarchaeota archaeon]
MVTTRNKFSAFLAIVAGILLVISGEQGPSGTYRLIMENLSLAFNNVLLVQLIQFLSLIFVAISLVGGFVVILGGYLILKDKPLSGKILIGVGTGFGVVSVILLFLSLYQTENLMTVLTRYTLIEWGAIILSLMARFIAK